ncbi:MAG: hypothetical protein ACKOYN_02385 [Planctomycetota bacterium]
MRQQLTTVLAFAAASCALANEITYDCAVSPSASSVLQTLDLSAPFAGTLKGNYNAKTNPTGTLTLPGFFGGSGNNPIPYTASFVLAGDIDTQPTGSLRLGVDSEGLQIRVGNLAFDLLGGEDGVLATTLNINYQTFRTQNPSSLFPGGVTIPIPLGNATISEFTATQVGPPVFGALTPQKTGSGFTFNVAVPVEFVIVADALGQPVSDGTPVPAVLPLTGTIVEVAGGVAITLDIQQSAAQTTPIEADPFTDIALALPTVFPTGGTANLLLSGDVTSVTVANTLDANIVANGTVVIRTGDLNADGSVNVQDVTIMFANWGTAGLGDLDGNGRVEAPDLAILCTNWG